MTALRAVRYAAWAAVLLACAVVGYFALVPRDGGGAIDIASIGGPFTLTDQNGQTVTDASLKGHPSAIFFGYTFCPDVCPTTLFEVTDWLGKLGPDADRLKVYFVSVDPERDTQEKLADYLKAFDPRITGLTGSPEAVDGIAKAYRVFYRKVPIDGGGYLMDHTASIYLLNGDGTFTGTIAYEENEDAALAKLRRLLGTS